ncbi:hypothetical protein [Peribacillus frigoritolerans]|uniref:hypothetical protein n=1 Tax=Peribacillus frigoritolerans TaxID=450367 RepID=UPI003F7EBA88
MAFSSQILVSLILILLFLSFMYFRQLNMLKKEIMHMPMGIRTNIKKHKLIGESINSFRFFRRDSVEKNLIILITDPTCLHCNNALSELIKLALSTDKLTLFHWISRSEKGDSRIIEKRIDNSKKNYYQINVITEKLYEYDLNSFPTYILVKNQEIIEVTSSSKRISYLINNELGENINE